ncbi:MAG: carbon-nitrogen hydrolase family protein [Gemmobacter sp.]|nr:carbon-nitrogen hydrolase family protein [Gemmobacter sp.]
MTSDLVRIAAAAYPLTWFDDFTAYEAKLTSWVAKGAATGADLLVFPEYGAMELASLGGAKVAADLQASLLQVAGHRAASDALHLRLAAQHGIHILGASGPVFADSSPGKTQIAGSRPVNRATFFGPNGVIGHQDKQIMTRFEREDWCIRPGDALRVFNTPLGRIGIIICYDSEFPLLARSLAERGVEILLVPSCTETMAGFSRVRIGSMARALESQCVVVQSPLVGLACWCAGVEANRGRAAIYGPPDDGWPDDGILAQTTMDEAGWAVADISRALIDQTRRDGGVLNLLHWPEQTDRLALGE